MNSTSSRAIVPASEEQREQPSFAQSFQPVALAARADGWTPERQRQFIEELADCGIVREAAARVGMSEQGAYQLRRRPDAAGFNQAWMRRSSSACIASSPPRSSAPFAARSSAATTTVKS